MPQPIDILLVDDEPRNLDALESILADPGYRLLRAQDADTALLLLLENDVAAIVLDIKMPGVTGFELAQLIKGTKRYRQIPIVFLTAYLVDDQDVVAGYGAGAVDYLTKPVNPDILRHKVSVFADLFRKTRALAELNDHLEARVQQRTAELARSEAALRAANQQKDAFLATLAHELRNPLAPLRTGLDLLLRSEGPSSSTPRVLEIMNRQLKHMVRLIDDLLDISRVTRGMLELKKESIALSSVLEAAVEASRPALEQRQQSIKIRADADVTAFADATRVSQIVGNLLQNASKWTASGGEIEVELSSAKGQAVIRVIDHGAGIPPDQLSRVFELFAKVARPAAHSDDGLGIGLALSRQLAELHGGTLTATSAGEGQGATFTLCLPAQPEGTVAAAHEQGSDAYSASSMNPLSIVVIEDNEDAAETLVLWLELMGHKVSLAGTGPQGLALVRDVRPDAVLCDLGLPDMSGDEVCRAVRELPASPLMIALTGWGMERDLKRTREAGFDHHLVKPVDPEQLRAILARRSRSSVPERSDDAMQRDSKEFPI